MIAVTLPSLTHIRQLKVLSDGTLTGPFPPTVLPIGGTVPVRAEGIAVLGSK